MTPTELEKIEGAIAVIKIVRIPRNVKNNLINNYTDFLREKDLLKYHYNFNLSVFNSLVKLADVLWNSNQRFNRSEILKTTKIL